jgi:lipopolysaccharide transport system permease protein
MDSTWTVVHSHTKGFIDLRQLWRFRDLLFVLVERDVRVRYKQMYLGIAWVVIQPLAMAFVFTLFMGRFLPASGSGPSPVVFTYAALLPWTFFSTAVTTSASSLVTSSNLISKVYFPRIVIPLSGVLSGLIDLAIGFIALLGILVFKSVPLSAGMLFLPVILLVLILFACAVGTLTAAVNVKYRDSRYVVPFAMQLWMFASPVFYSTASLEGTHRQLALANPLTGIIESVRAALFGTPIPWDALGISALASVATLTLASVYFGKVSTEFADVI